jgi:hypothetical protein
MQVNPNMSWPGSIFFFFFLSASARDGSAIRLLTAGELNPVLSALTLDCDGPSARDFGLESQVNWVSN